MKKKIIDIKKGIIKYLLSSEYEITDITSVSESMNSNWLTTIKYMKELEKVGVVKLFRVNNKKIVGVNLNIEAFILVDEVLREDPEMKIYNSILEKLKEDHT